MKPMQTPKTLNQAILNGLEHADLDENSNVIAETVRDHVRDFLSQKFCATILNQEGMTRDLCELWKEITGEDLGTGDIARRVTDGPQD